MAAGTRGPRATKGKTRTRSTRPNKLNGVEKAGAIPKIGRPLMEIDDKVVASLAFAGVPIAKIARHVGCDRKTLYNRFSTLLDQNDVDGEVAIYVRQHNAAMAGDRTMLVWLGKTRLGQKEALKIGGDPDGSPIRTTMSEEKIEERRAEIVEATRLAAERERIRRSVGRGD